jgi:hypothetical protein
LQHFAQARWVHASAKWFKEHQLQACSTCTGPGTLSGSGSPAAAAAESLAWWAAARKMCRCSLLLARCQLEPQPAPPQPPQLEPPQLPCQLQPRKTKAIWFLSAMLFDFELHLFRTGNCLPKGYSNRFANTRI